MVCACLFAHTIQAKAEESMCTQNTRGPATVLKLFCEVQGNGILTENRLSSEVEAYTHWLDGWMIGDTFEFNLVATEPNNLSGYFGVQVNSNYTNNNIIISSGFDPGEANLETTSEGLPALVYKGSSEVFFHEDFFRIYNFRRQLKFSRLDGNRWRVRWLDIDWPSGVRYSPTAEYVQYTSLVCTSRINDLDCLLDKYLSHQQHYPEAEIFD